MADIRHTQVLDNFQRANEDPISWNGAWAATDLGWRAQGCLKSHGFTDEVGQGTGESYWTAGAFAPNGTKEVEVWGYPAAGGVAGIAWSLGLWVNPGGTVGLLNGYRLRSEVSTGGSGWALYRVVGGGLTQIGTDHGGAFSAPDSSLARILLKRNGSKVEGWYSNDAGANWSLGIDATDSTYTGAFFLGCGITCNSGDQLLSWAGFGGGTPPSHSEIYRYVQN